MSERDERRLIDTAKTLRERYGASMFECQVADVLDAIVADNLGANCRCGECDPAPLGAAFVAALAVARTFERRPAVSS